MMASNFNPDPPTGSDSDGRPDNTTADTDPHEDMDTEPSDLSGCRPRHDLVPEDEIFYEGETAESKSEECKKNPGHTKFIPVRDFTMDLLPRDTWREKIMRRIKEQILWTVHIRVNYTSENRPDTFYDKRTSYPIGGGRGSFRSRTGTGYIVLRRWEPEIGDCPCPACKKSGNPQTRYWKYRVLTAAHVVYDDDEARKTVIKCFYDSEEQNEDVVKLYGVGLDSKLSQEKRYETDLCDRLVCVTHDEQSAQKIDSRLPGGSPYYGSAVGIMVSHPHGGPKMVSLGKILDVTYLIKPEDDRRSRKLPNDTTCHLPSDSTGELVPFRKRTNLRSRPKSLIFPRNRRYLRGATFTVPDDAEYLMRVDYNKDWLTFPPGTTFHSNDGKALKTRDGTTIPDNAVFMFMKIRTFYKSMNFDGVLQHVSYDIPTCPGSSGAHVTVPVFECIPLSYTPDSRPHAGSGVGCNRSCLLSGDVHLP